MHICHHFVSGAYFKFCKLQRPRGHLLEWMWYLDKNINSCTLDKDILDFTLEQKILSYQGYPTQGKIKIENSHVFVWDVTYAIVKVDVSIRLDVTKRHSNVITILSQWLHYQASTFRNEKVCKKKNLPWVWGIDRKFCPSGSQSGITRQDSWCQTMTLGTDFSIYPSHSW